MPGNEVRKLRRASCQGNRRAVPRLAHVTRGELRSKHTGEPTVTRIIRRAEVVERTGLSESSIQRRLKSGEFPFAAETRRTEQPLGRMARGGHRCLA